ncbi:MAG: hypothetical protein E7589_00870 [Ruminococcaceae bacterium]|nr:hypothetical protein [Oscillospiraceae bacterium]
MADSTLNIVGNAELLARIRRDVMSNTLSHAYIIEGRKGSGKHTMAKHIALALACRYSPKNLSSHNRSEISMFDMFEDEPPTATADRPPCCFEGNVELCTSCRKLLEGKCPDLHVIGRDGKATIGVEAIRKLRSSVHLAPIDMETKIYVIEDAEAMTVQAQNALLLTLEEPPPYVLFLLLCNNSEALLETIKSRAPTLRTENLSDTQVAEYIVEHSKDVRNLRTASPAEFETIILSADGCIGRALELTDTKERKKISQRRTVADDFISLCRHRDSKMLPALIPAFGNKRDEAIEILRLISLALRDLLLVKRCESVVLKYYTDANIALAISDDMTSQFILNVYNAVENAVNSFERNGNLRLTLTRMCVDAELL